MLPGALSPEALFDAVREARVLIGEAPEGAWGFDSRRLIHDSSPGSGVEYVVSNRGGYVTGFEEIFDAGAFADRIESPERLDRLTQWLLHCAGVALRDAGVDTPPPGSGLIVGNLSYPTVEHTRFVQDYWLGAGKNAPIPGRAGVDSDPRNRFSSGAPIHIVARAFGLTGDVFALDAACASSLYALEIACRRLQDRESDLMLAGGAAGADPLFIYLGFTALQALSPSGRSRPLHKGADGLLPAEGAGLVVLKRVDDAVRDGDRIFGLIRGIGLSNDGRQSGFLAPATDGQVRAMESAYAQAGLTPQDIDFIECHATGTPRGDTVELDSLAQIWGDGPKPAIGSLKGNIGHPITASGVASLIKMLSAFEARLLPPTPCDDPLDEISSHGFTLLTEAAPWESDGPRRAAISNFGFGGNNAHLIVEEWTGVAPRTSSASSVDPMVRRAGRIAISAIGVIAGESVGLPAFVRRLVDARGTESTVVDEIALGMAGLGFPPNDMKEALAQQTSILAVVEEVLGQVGDLNAERTGVYIGMCVDPEVARHGLRVRLRDLISEDVDMEGWRAANTNAAKHLTAAGVIGCMPNIPANRIHAQQDWRAPGFTVASEELSGIDALKLAVRALQAGEIDAALVGASDFSHEGSHVAAAAAVLPEDRQSPGDAAVAFIVMREEDAVDKGYPVLALLTETVESSGASPVELSLTADAGMSEVTARFGHAHGAAGLLHVAAGAITAHLGVEIDRDGAWPSPRRKDSVHTRVTAESFSGMRSTVQLVAPVSTSALISPVGAPACEFYAAGSVASLASAVAAGEQSFEGAVRLALVAKAEADLDRLRAHAEAELAAGRAPAGPGLYFGEGTLDGEVAFCYTGAAAAYAGAARDLLLAFPKIGQNLAERFAGTPHLAADLYGAGIGSFPPATQLTGSSFVCQVHTEFTRNVLGMKPEVAMGLSSGETNSLMAFGVWNDLDEMVAEINTSEMYINQLTGECRAAAEFWGLPEGEVAHWRNYRIAAPIETIEQAMEGEPRVYITVIQHREDVVIGGDADACERVIEKVGRTRAIDLGLDMVVHCAPLRPFAKTWHQIHERDTSEVPEVRFYTNAGNRAYVPTRDAAADAITQQAVDPIDFPKTVERAYEDGVRVFIEHGPRATLTGAIGRILEGRPHTVVALDPHEGSGLEPMARSVSRLWAVGVPMDLTEFAGRLRDLREGARPRREADGPVLRLRVHSPPITWPDMTTATTSAAPRSAALHDSQNAAVSDSMNAKTSSPPEEEMAPPPAAGLEYDIGKHFGSGRSPAAQPAVGISETRSVAASAEGNGVSSAAQDPALDLFSSIAKAHADFLREQKETHDAFLAIGLQGAFAQGAPAAPPVTEPHAPAVVASAQTLAPERAPDLRVVVAPAPTAPESTQPASPEPVSPEPASPESVVASRADSGPPSPVIPVSPPINRAEMPETVFLNREQLEIHSGGKISEIFGELFEKQDGYTRQVRMPEPPLLFVDRALMIEGEPGGMKKGRVVTETDVQPDAWYLHNGRMAPGIVIESGQADLLLISWLGADFHNQGDRVYRLLGCDLTYYGGLPAPGDTLTYEIFVDGHAKTGDVRLFFFHYDCYIGDRLLISVRNGQAGFFTKEELAGSAGVLWDAAEDDPKPDARLDPPPQLTTKRSFSREDLQHFRDGDAYRCFGKGFELAASHTRTPNIPDGRLNLLDHVPLFDPEGGPWGRGYLRAETHVPVDAWFYDGHFNNDPCMPGTLMADAATQALSFAMAAMGFTIRRDGWRFEPVSGELARFLCRGQVVPDGPHTLDYEVFIEEVIDGDEPEVYASLLCTSDGLKVFQCRRFGMRLVPDYPLTTMREYLEGAEPPRLVGPGDSDVRGDYEALLACAWGRPSDAFGSMFAKFDGALKCPRLPGPPYHFISSIVSVDVAPGSAGEGGIMVSTLDLDPEAWYFEEGQGHMPYAVVVEAFLQPCGWFASYLNFFADTVGDVAFRNLDGVSTLHKQIHRDMGTLTFTTRLTRFAKAGGTSIVFFEVECEDEHGPVLTLTTDFGFFSPKVLEDQRGLATTDEMRARRDEESPTPPLPLLDGGGALAHLPAMSSGKLRMVDEITGFWPDAGDAGLGRIRAYQKLHPDSWYFKAHFYEDPVQPGSLGLEALVQTSRALMHLKGWLDGIENPVWEHPIVGMPLEWRYRGQVVPLNHEVITEVEALEVEIVEGESVTLQIYGTQWVDGLRIYEVPAFAIRVRAGGE